MVPNAGAIMGIQNRMISRSGSSFLISLPTEIQLKGLTELTLIRISRSAGAG